jgi:PIN domain nuclease of toxin-antitoxin system
VTVFDSSALLAFLQGEDGAATVEAALESGGACGAANWSEIAQKIRVHGQRWVRGEGLSLADRLCLALGDRLDADVLTADAMWGSHGRIRQIR